MNYYQKDTSGLESLASRYQKTNYSTIELSIFKPVKKLRTLRRLCDHFFPFFNTNQNLPLQDTKNKENRYRIRKERTHVPKN
jgi:hypothetical protein